MDDPTLTPATTALAPLGSEEQEPSSGVRKTLTDSAKKAGIDRATLLGEIGHGLPVSQQQRKALAERSFAPDDIVSILPTGIVYVEGKHWRKVLNDVFGKFQWGIVSVSEPVLELAPPDAKGVKSMLYLEVFLIIKGRCVASAIGAQEYHPSNKQMTKDDALEGCRSNGIMRCLKPFGIYENLWDSKWLDPALERLGVKVRTSDNWRPVQWRRLDDAPFDNEVGIAPGSPNAEAYAERFPDRKYQTREPRQQQEQAPPRQQAAPKPAEPVRDVEVVEHAQQTSERPEKLLTIRPSFYNTPEGRQPMWIVQTDQQEYVTNDPEMHKNLEQHRPHKRMLRVTYEVLRGNRGIRRRILSFVVAE